MCVFVPIEHGGQRNKARVKRLPSDKATLLLRETGPKSNVFASLLLFCGGHAIVQMIHCVVAIHWATVSTT